MKLKHITSILTLWLLALGVFTSAPKAHAQAPKTVDGPAITGTMEITFNTRLSANTDSEGKPLPGIIDTYKVDMTAGNISIKGKIERTPRIASKILGTEKQKGKLFYQLAWSFKGTYLGDWLGTVVTNERGEYLWDGAGDPNSKPRIQIMAVGNQAGFTDYFTGVMVGKGNQPGGSAKFFRKLAGGKVATYTATNTDPMDFRGLTVAKGPLGAYSAVTFDGKLIYDRESGSWLTEGINATTAGIKQPDKITGSIRWNEDPNRSSNGKGQYVLNLRWNEDRVQPSDETFSSGPIDEESFFAVDPAKPGLTGTVDYEDKLNSEGTPVYSKVSYNIKATRMERAHILAFLKLWLVGIGPLNDE
jgi:hypothetical protein